MNKLLKIRLGIASFIFFAIAGFLVPEVPKPNDIRVQFVLLSFIFSLVMFIWSVNE